MRVEVSLERSVDDVTKVSIETVAVPLVTTPEVVVDLAMDSLKRVLNAEETERFRR